MMTLMLGAILVAPPVEWKFVDDSVHKGRSLATFRTVELAGSPTTPLNAADVPPAGSRYGSVGVGPGGRRRLGVVWNRDGKTLWFDADGDGRYSDAERHTLGNKPLEAKVAVPSDTSAKLERTVLIRPRGDGVAWAVRGYTTGTVALNGKPVAALLADGDADGCFDGAGADRVWLDLDADGTFDPLTEQFPLGTAIAAGGTAVLIRPRADGLGLEARERPNETGTLRVDVVRLPKVAVTELAANYVSEFGELIVVKDAGKAVPLPAGKYRVDSVRLKLADADGKVWHYSFSSGDRAYSIEVAKGKETASKLLDGLNVTVALDAVGGVLPGASVQVQPDVVAGELYLTRCEVGTKFAEYGREVMAEIKLTEPGSITLDRCDTGFN